MSWSEPVFSEEQIAKLVAPYLERLPPGAVADVRLYERLRVYLELLLRWNARTNLTAVRDPAEMVRRHFGESLFAGCVLGDLVGGGADVLDLGSGAGFPGVPVQLLLPEMQVTLAESQGKKAAFLREVVRELGLKCEVWGRRVEDMPLQRRFEAVVLRAVDRMEVMVEVGRARALAGGVLLEMVGKGEGTGAGGVDARKVPGSAGSWVRISRV